MAAIVTCVLAASASATSVSKLPAGANHARAHANPHFATGAGVSIGILESDSGITGANSNLGARLMGQFDYDKRNPSQGPAGAINTGVTGGSTHTSLVANTAAGSNNGGFIGVAPGAAVYVGGVFDNTSSDAQVYHAIRNATNDLRVNQNVYLYNFSMDAVLANRGPDNGQDNPALYLDWFQHTYDALVVKSAGNRGAGDKDITSPGTMFNGIVVGNANGNRRATGSSYWTPGDDGTSPDIRGLPHILAPGTNIGDNINASSGTSFAAPHVAGAAALLMDNGLNLPGPGASPRNHLAIKALILNSARKRHIVGPENSQASALDNAATGAEASDGDYLNGAAFRINSSTAAAPKTANWTPTQWTHAGGVFSTNRPLDDEQGTGLLDAERALINMDGGEQAAGDVTPIGWDRSAVLGNAEEIYTLDFGIAARSFGTFTLTWDRIITEADGDAIVEDADTYTFASLADLDLEVYFQGSLIAESAGVGGALGENVEHLHIPFATAGLAGDYEFRVENNSVDLVHFGVAWWVQPIPEPATMTLVITCSALVVSRRRRRAA